MVNDLTYMSTDPKYQLLRGLWLSAAGSLPRSSKVPKLTKRFGKLRVGISKRHDDNPRMRRDVTEIKAEGVSKGVSK